MRKLSSSAWALALLVGCVDPAQDESGVGGGGDAKEEPAVPTLGDPVEPGCLELTPTGTVTALAAVGYTAFFGPSTDYPLDADVAVDANDDVLHAFPYASTTAEYGLIKLANSLEPQRLYTKSFGELLATDSDGNVYIAGMFDRVIDFGAGRVSPHGDGHAYLVKLDSAGNLVYAKELFPCGTLSVTSLAVAADGRIAISGVGLGTAVLDANAELLFAVDLVGHVAFDSQGNLVITGELDTDAFIAKLDTAGAEIFRILIGDDPSFGTFEYPANVQTGVGVAIDAEDNIIVIGEFERTVLLFGAGYEVVNAGEADNDGGFVVKLDANGNFQWRLVQQAERMIDVAIDPLGNVVVAGTEVGGIFPYEIPFLYKLDEQGSRLWAFANYLGIGYGHAGGLATDSCGNTFWSVTMRPNFEPDQAPLTSLVKLAL